MKKFTVKALLQPIRELLRKNEYSDQQILRVISQLRLERGHLGEQIQKVADKLLLNAHTIGYVGGEIGETSASLVWHYPGKLQKGFEVVITSPIQTTTIVSEPEIELTDLQPHTTYHGNIRSLDNEYAVADFSFWTRPKGVTGYTLPMSAEPGESVDLFISSPQRTAKIILRSASNLDQTYGEWTIATSFQPAPYHASSEGCQWRRSLTVALPADLPSDGYTFDVESIEDGIHFFIPLIVRPHQAPDVAVVFSTDTWNAYNDWGGHSYYDNWIKVPEPLWNSEARPNYIADPCSQGAYLMGAEMHVLKHFRRHQIPYGVYSDIDLTEGRLAGCKTIVLCAHNEYWCAKKVAEFDSLMQAGVNVISLSGNTLFRRLIREPVRLAGSRYGYYNDEEVCTRLGSIYTAEGRETGAPFAVTDADHWIFEGSGVANGDLFGIHSVPELSASALETDKVTAFSPANVEMVAKGTNVVGGAEWIVFRHFLGGLVVNPGSITVTLHMADPVIDRMILNVMQRLGHVAAAAIIPEGIV